MRIVICSREVGGRCYLQRGPKPCEYLGFAQFQSGVPLASRWHMEKRASFGRSRDGISMLEGTNIEAQQTRKHDSSRVCALDMPSDLKALLLHEICAGENDSDGSSS